MSQGNNCRTNLSLPRGHLTCILSLSLFWSLSAWLYFYEMLMGTKRAVISVKQFWPDELRISEVWYKYVCWIFNCENRSRPPVFLPSWWFFFFSMCTLQICPYRERFSWNVKIKSSYWDLTHSLTVCRRIIYWGSSFLLNNHISIGKRSRVLLLQNSGNQNANRGQTLYCSCCTISNCHSSEMSFCRFSVCY